MKVYKDIPILIDQGLSFIVITITEVRGSSPQDPGAKAIVTKDGLYSGTVGGGKVEARAIEYAKKMLNSNLKKRPTLLTWNLQKDIGMTCGGEVSFLFEHYLSQSWPIIIFGAGHVSQALTRTLSKLQCQVTCIDSRREWLERLDDTNFIHHENPCELVKKLNPSSFFISMTQGHAFDVPILHEIFKHAPLCPYVGVIGSKTKGMKIKSELKELGTHDNFLEKLRVPIGMDIGTNDPYEIAISITAELIGVRDNLNLQ